MVVPGAVPQPPVHVSAVRSQLFGSRNPSCAGVSATPNVEFASKVRFALAPRHAGSVALIAASASARPAPNTLSGVAVLRRTALLSSRLRTAPRAVAAAIVDVLRFSRQGAPCSSSAATPATCGAAADVPKNVVPNDPAPVIETPSIAAMSGFCRPSSVGPRLLKNSAVRFDVSRHDSSGTRFEKKFAAFADAEQIAPTEMTPPPASLCADTLRVAVLKLWRSWRGGAR